ncbi:MAG: c-type cytochrome [Pseudomonadota bacterium]
MKFFGKGIQTAAAASALCIFLVACGGSEPEAPENTIPATPDVEAVVADATDDVTDTVEDVVADVEEAGEAAVEDASDAMDDAADMVDDAVEDGTDMLEDAGSDVAEIVETAEDTVEETVEAATDAVADERVSAEVIAQYASLTGDAAKGQRVFTQCMSCHAVQEGRNMAGPSMFGIVGRPAGTVEGFRYSDANANSGIVWTEATMFAYLEAPQQFIPGTIMAFPGLPSAQDRADVIAYLKQQS